MVDRLLIPVAAVLLAAPTPREELAAIPLRTLEGAAVSSPAAAVLVVSVWSSSCAACIGQLHNLEALARVFEGDPEVAFLALNVDAFVGTPRAARDKGWKKLHSTLPTAEDPHAQFIRTLEAWVQHGPSCSPDLAATVTLPALYVVDAKGNSFGDLKYFRDTKASELVERYRPIVEKAKAGRLGDSVSGNSVVTTLDTESHEVGVSRGKVRLKFAQMTASQISRALPDVKRQLTQMFPKASDAQLEGMLEKVRQAMTKGEPVEFDSQ